MESSKIIPYKHLKSWRDMLPNFKMVVTNGCFNILHYGHIKYLKEAKAKGNCLLVGINSDKSLSLLKSPKLLIPDFERTEIIASLEFVNAVCIFDDAAEFIRLSRPVVYVKGGDYTIDTINQNDRKSLEDIGSKVIFTSLVKGRSSSSIAASL